jgi:O-antigen ligase
VLSDHERKTLREVECQLMAEDPEFARSFEAGQARLSRHPRRLGVRIGVVVAALLTALLLVTWSLAGALVFAVTAGLIWVAWRDPGDTDEWRAPPVRE